MATCRITKTVAWYNQNANKFSDLIENLACLENIDFFTNQLPLGAKVLDAGCGPGRDTYLLSKNGLKLTGLDLSSELIKIAEKQCPDSNFVIGNLLNLPFEDNSFDGIWANACLVHIKNNRSVLKVLREFYRVLKNNGILHVYVRANLGGKKILYVKDQNSKFKRLFHNFTIKELSGLLGKTGFYELTSVQQKEIGQHLNGRPDVEWIQSVSRKK